MKRTLSVLLCLLMVFLTACEKKPTVTKAPDNNNVAGGFRIHVISLGKADAILVTADGEAMLIDAGYDGQGEEITEYLKKQGVSKLRYLVLTHGDRDHVGGAAEVIRSITVEQVFLSPKKESSSEYAAMAQALADTKTKYSMPELLFTFSLGKAVFTVLAPGQKALAEGDDNNSSLVLRGVYGERTALFMGDALSKSEKEIRESGYELRAEVIKIGHHGQKDATTKKFIKEVAPQYALITCSLKEPADEDALSVLKAFSVNIFRTDVNGTVVLSTDGTRWEVQTER